MVVLVHQRQVPPSEIFPVGPARVDEFAQKHEGPARVKLVRVDIVALEARPEPSGDQGRAAVALHVLADGIEAML
jgi:hypothetical protein